MDYKNNKTSNRRRYKSRYHSPHNYKTQRSKSENRAAILVGVATFIVLAALVLVFTFGDNIYSFLDETFHPSSILKDQAPTLGVAKDATEAPTDSPTVSADQAPSQLPTESASTAPQSGDFTQLAAAAGLNPASLSGSQLIIVQTSGTDAVVYTYEKDGSGAWQQKFEPIYGYCGEDGAGESVPYDHVTPKGVYNIEYAMGTNPDPGTALSYKEIVYGMRWITDPNSVNYNRLIDGDATYIDFDSYQDLYEYTVTYPYAVIFNYNRDNVDTSKGAAKFLHVASQPTRGGVGISEESLYNILLWLDPAKAPQIAIF